jgi:hypothetical protein
MTYRLGCESLWLLILALALVLAVPAGAQEANPPLASDSAAVIPSEAVEPEELTRARSILAEADSVWMRLRGMLDEATDDLGTEEREILRVGALELIEAAEDRTHELVRLSERLDQDGEPTDSLRIAGVSQVRARMGFYLRGIERSVNRLADLRRGRADLPVVELVD